MAQASLNACCRNLSTAEDALRHATDLQKDGLRSCQEEFLTVLNANMQEPNAARLVQASANVVIGEASVERSFDESALCVCC